MKTVMIPTFMSPYKCTINGVTYVYPAGTEQTVPDEVAALIENITINAGKRKPAFDEEAIWNAIDINSEAVKSKADKITLEPLGKTPYTHDALDLSRKIYLSGEGTYVGYTDTASDINTAVITPRSTYWDKDNTVDYYKYDLVHTGSGWSQNYITVKVDGLIPGKEYKAVIDASNIVNPIAAPAGWFRVSVDYEEGTPTYNVLVAPNTVCASKTFTATANTKNIRIYLSKTGAAGDYVAFRDIYVKLASTDDKKTEIQNISGTVDGMTELPLLVSGIHIETSAECNVYDGKPLSNVYTVNKQLPDESGDITIKPFAGKTIVNFGDSIFGNYSAPTDISSYLADLSGATVYNVGFGGCRMAKHSSNGYKAFSMYKLADEIVKPDSDLTKWAAQDEGAAVSGVPSYFADHLATLKSIDFGKVDIITIAYGTNDFTAGVILDNDEDKKNTNYYAGALRYSVEKILAAFPNIKIFVCGQVFRFWTEEGVITEDSDSKEILDVADPAAGRTLLNFVSKTKAVAEEYHLPFIDNYYGLGINIINCTNYIPLSDGTHPNSKGRRLIAQHICHELF